jgi:hypothetical protein
VLLRGHGSGGSAQPRELFGGCSLTLCCNTTGVILSSIDSDGGIHPAHPCEVRTL